jgi:hypothetical protein
MAIQSPMDYQVFQRRTRTEGQILVKGRALINCDRVEARIRTGPVGPVPVDGWVLVPYRRSSQAFRAALTARAGGFYAVDVRLMKSGKVLVEESVPHVGVGDVFVIAGQSNATNYGEVRQKTKTGMVVSFDGHSWRMANDPQPGVVDASSKGSFIPSFGDALYHRYGVPIGVACVGHGATSVRQWLPKGEHFRVPPTMSKFVIESKPGDWESNGALFDGMMERIRELGRGGFRALLWHQGESDANQKPGHQISGKEYGRLLAHIIRQSGKDAGWHFPWFVAEASYHTPSDPSSPEIREAQRALWASGIAQEGPDTDRLVGRYRQNNGAGVHFSAEGLDAHGKLWAEKVEAYLDAMD